MSSRRNSALPRTLSVGIVKIKVTGLNLSCAPSSPNQQVILLILTRKLLMNLLSLMSPPSQLFKSFQLIMNYLRTLISLLKPSLFLVLVSTTTLILYWVTTTGSRNVWLILAPTLTVSVMIGLPTLTSLSGHTILNVVQSRPLEVIT